MRRENSFHGSNIDFKKVEQVSGSYQAFLRDDQVIVISLNTFTVSSSCPFSDLVPCLLALHFQLISHLEYIHLATGVPFFCCQTLKIVSLPFLGSRLHFGPKNNKSLSYS